MCAAAYGKLSRLGVCIGTSGPGASHLVSGAIDAQLDRVPMLVLTGLKDLGKLAHSDFQDIDQTSLFKAAGLPYSVTIASPHQVLPLMRDAISMALSQSVCVHVALPFDLQSVTITVPEVLCARRADFRFSGHPFKDDLEATAKILCNELRMMSRVVICVGYRGFKYASALIELAEALNAPILTSLDSKGVIPEDHYLSHGVLGVFGNAGTLSGARLMANADCVLSFCVVDHHQMLTNAEGLQARRLIIFHESTYYADWRFTVTASVIGHLDNSTRIVAKLVKEQQSVGGIPVSVTENSNSFLDTPSTYVVPPEECGQVGYCHPGAFLSSLSKELPEDTLICVDVGDITLWSAMTMCLNKTGQRVLSSEHMGIMGYSLCAAIASHTLHPNAQKIVIAGDGGFQMSLQEMATLNDHGANKLLIVIMLNHRLGRVQNESWGEEAALGCGIGAPDFVKLGEAYGAKGLLLDSDDQSVIDEAIKSSLGQPGIRIVVVQQNPDVKPIMHRRPAMGVRDHVSLYDRGLLNADSLCPELASAVVFERPDKEDEFSNNASSIVRYHGSVSYVIAGSIPPKLLETQCDCRDTKHGIGEGSPLGISSMGEGLVLNGLGYARSCDKTSIGQTLSGPYLTSGCLVGLGPLSASPKFRAYSKFDTTVSLTTLCTHIIDLSQSHAIYVAGIITFNRGNLAGSALCKAPIYGENILDNKSSYFAPLNLENAEMAYVTGVVAGDVDKFHSELRRILYHGASSSLSTHKSSVTVMEDIVEKSIIKQGGIEMHLHGLVLNKTLCTNPTKPCAENKNHRFIPLADITPAHAAVEGVLHLDCMSTTVINFDFEVFDIDEFQEFYPGVSHL